MNTFITILILILMLGILLATHELGHLLLAKGFNVFCLEYSIGFGPRLFKFRKRGGETDYSLRLLPLGGYVSMYAEGVELEDGQSVPPERSIEGISAGKRALVMLGGIAMNLLFSLIFTFTELSPSDLTSAARLQWDDFEDALQSVTAERIHADYIVTRNVRDFLKSKITAFTPAELRGRM